MDDTTDGFGAMVMEEFFNAMKSVWDDRSLKMKFYFMYRSYVRPR